MKMLQMHTGWVVRLEVQTVPPCFISSVKLGATVTGDPQGWQRWTVSRQPRCCHPFASICMLGYVLFTSSPKIMQQLKSTEYKMGENF